MKKHLLLILLTATLFGCATKIYRKVPPLKDPNEFSEIVIIRNKAIFGSAVGIGVQIDGYKIASLSVGHHLRLKVDPGQHAVGTMSGSITLNFDPRKTYCFLTGIGMSGDQNIERIDGPDAVKWLIHSTAVIVE
jgi:hypothetical protein